MIRKSTRITQAEWLGGALPISTFQKMLKSSMDTAPNEIDGYVLDQDISQNTARVYHNSKNNKTIVIHRGTASSADWLLNLSYALGTEQYLPRWQISKQVQDNAERKYGQVETIGSSLGATLASDLSNGKIITYNKPIYLHTKQKEREHGIRTQYDPVSLLNIATNTRPMNEIIIPSPIPFGVGDVLEEHKSGALSRLDPDMVVGEGCSRGGGFKLLPLREGVLKTNVLSNIQIDKMMKRYSRYNGSYCKDVLPSQLKIGWYIVNMENHTKDGSHWTAFFYDPKCSIYFDSFGIIPSKEVEYKIIPYVYNNRQIQDIDSTSCGYYSTECIKFCENFKNQMNAFNTFCGMFSSNTKLNENILAKLIGTKL